MEGNTSIAKKSKVTKDYTEIHFFDEVYRIYLVFMISSREKLKEFIEDYKLNEDVVESMGIETASGFCIRFDSDTCKAEGANFSLIWAQARELPLLVHELAHLSMMTFDEKGIPIRIENQETFAYYIEHWVKRITEVWNVPKVKHKKKSDIIKAHKVKEK